MTLPIQSNSHSRSLQPRNGTIEKDIYILKTPDQSFDNPETDCDLIQKY